MYEKNGKQISEAQALYAANSKGISLEEWLSATGYVKASDVGKQNSSAETTPPVSLNQTPAGDSSSGNISLESQGYDLTGNLTTLAEQGLFNQVEEDGQLSLESYFEPIKGLSFEQKGFGTDYIVATYVDPVTGEKKESNKISFDETREDQIANNIAELSNFISSNVSSEEIAGIKTNIDGLVQSRKEEVASFINDEDVASITEKYSGEDLFAPYEEFKNPGGVAMIGAPESALNQTVYPYKDQLDATKKDLIEYAEANNISFTEEEIQQKSEQIVRNTLIQNDILDLKILRAKESTKDAQEGVEDGTTKFVPGVGAMYMPGQTKSKQGDQFIADIFINDAAAAEFNAATEKWVAVDNELAIAREAADLMGKMYSGENLNNDEAAQLVTDLSELGIFIDMSNQNMVRFDNGVEMLQPLYEAGVKLSNTYEALNVLGSTLEEQKLKAAEAEEDASIAIDASKRNYNLFAKSVNTVGTGFAEIALNLASLANNAPSINPVILASRESNNIAINQAGQFLDAQREQYQRDVNFEDAFSDAGNFGEFMLQEVSTQIPILVTMIASGGSASYVAGISGAGDKYRSMVDEEIEGTAQYSELEKFLKSTGYGLAEGVFSEITTTRIIRNTKAKWIQAGKSDILDNSSRAYAKNNLLELGLEPLAEAGGEVLTTASQNLIDGRPITEGLDHSGFSGYSMGLIMQAVPFVRGVYVSRHSDYKLKETIRMKQAEAQELQRKIAQETDVDKIEKLRGQLANVNNEINNEIERVENLVNKHLTAKHAEAVKKVTRLQTELQLQAIEISKDESLTKKERNEKIQRLRNRFNGLQARKEQSLSKDGIMKFRSDFTLLQDTDKARYDAIADQASENILAKKGDSHEITPKELDAEAYDIFLGQEIENNNNQAANVEGAKVTQFKTTKEFIKALRAGVILPLEIEIKNEAGETITIPNPEIESSIQFLKEGADGFNIGDEVYISLENQISNQRKHIGTHEVGHYVFDKIFKGDEGTFNAVAKSLLKHAAKTLNRKEYKKFLASIEMDPKGNFLSTEVVSRFLELVADGQIGLRDVNKKRGLAAFFGATLEFVSKDQYDFDFKGEDDIVNFVVGLGNKIADGSLSLSEMKDASENIIAKPENNAETTAAAVKEARRYIKFSKGENVSAQADRAKQVLEKVSANMDYFDPNSPLIARVLPGMIQAQLSKLSNKGLQFDMDEANSDIILRLYSNQDIAKFDGRGTLYGYINGRIAFRIKDMLKASGEGKNDIVEDFNQSDVEDLKGAAADVTTIEQIEERTIEERPQYKKLLEKGIVSEDVLETVKGKIPRIVGTLKNRIDEKVSKNRTVTPMVNELRLALGKQIDIDLKKEMGGKKDGQLRKWLSANRKVILENMTTTYLMSAFPIAVQKKVDGVYTSDWKGKKIDRETTSTDKAGRTSGAEMVRRLPKASLKIDEKTFLSYILEESGNPIRGKKESLAKAIAEELAIEIINQEMQNPDSEIYQAFVANQERLGVELQESFVAKLSLDLERGNVKYSKTFTTAERRVAANAEAMRVAKDQIKGHLAKGFSFKEWKENEENYKEQIIRKANLDVTNVPFEKVFGTFDLLHEAGLLEYITDDKLKPFIKQSKLPGLGKEAAKNYTSLETLEKRAKEGDKKAAAELAKYVNEISNLALKIPAKELNRFGSFGTYNEIALATDGIALNTRVSKLTDKQLKATEKYPSTSKNSIRNRLIGLQRGSNTANQVIDTELLADIQEANIANEALSYSIAYDLIKAVKNGELSLENLMRLLQYMNKNQKSSGFRAFGKLTYFTNGISKRPYIEHVFPAQQLMNNIISLAADPDFGIDQFGELTLESQQALKNVLNKNTLLATDKASADFLDNAMGATSPAGIQRFEMYDDAAKNNIFATRLKAKTYEDWINNGKGKLVTLKEDLESKAEVEVYTKRIGISWSKAGTHKNMLVPSVKFSAPNPRAIFMVGGAGSGKSSVIKGLGLLDNGFRLINQDPYLEKYIAEAGLPTDESTYDKEQRSIRAKLGWKARKAAEADLENFTKAKESMIIDGTAASYKATTKKIKALEAAGFEVHMIFVNTSKDIASQRNAARSERSLPDFVVKKNWDQVQESAKQYREEYAGMFYELNTDELSYGDALPESFVSEVNNGLTQSDIKFSKGLNQEFNEMIERQKGIAADKTYSRVQAKMMGERKGKYRVFVPASADDFRGLTSYTFAGKGKQGEADQKFIEDNLINPYVRGVAQIEAIKQQVRREYHAVAKANKQYFKMLGKKISNTNYTYDQALRVYMWTQQGIEIPGMSKDDISFLINEINQFPGLIELGNSMQAISRQDTWVEPTEHWMSNTLVSDLNSMTEKVGRRKYLQEFIENSEIMFSPENLNKIEAVYGTRHREAIEDALYSMINGRNRPTGMNKQMNSWLNWVNNSTGAIMFFNIRSAVLQTLSSTNFINWSDNNPLKAAAAFANQKQYWSDFAMIFNSDKLKQRRSGLQTDVNTAEIANQAEGAQNKAGAVIAYLLKVGFTPTQIADSFAIATGGATFYRNRVNTYLKQGMELADAEKQAFEDFSKTADEAQQSSDPYLVSQEQRSPLGRLVLAFQNTPMQYTRLMKKAMLDLANGRGDAKTHISKIIYYGTVQNLIFSALQSALFAVIPGFAEEEDESELTPKELEKKREKEQRKEDTRILRIVNSMTDSILKGSGVKGAVLATIKNTITEYFKQEEKGFTADHTYTILQALSLSPPIGSKARKIYSSIQGRKFEKDVLEARGFSVMADGRVNLSPAYSIIGSLVSGVANVPMDRMVDIITSYSEALDKRNTAWQRIALALGWKTWDVGAKNEEHDLIKLEAKEKRKEEGKAKAKKTREENKKKKKERFDALTPAEKYEERRKKALERKNK